MPEANCPSVTGTSTGPVIHLGASAKSCISGRSSRPRFLEDTFTLPKLSVKRTFARSSSLTSPFSLAKRFFVAWNTRFACVCSVSPGTLYNWKRSRSTCGRFLKYAVNSSMAFTSSFKLRTAILPTSSVVTRPICTNQPMRASTLATGLYGA